MKKIVIVGGGIAGLSAGIYAQMCGFESVIFEKHSIVGGECTGWDREGYHIDGCIHWLTGTKENTPLNKMWKEVGALENTKIYHPETFMTFDYNGQVIYLYRDIEKLQKSLIELSPNDRDKIKEFCNDIKSIQDFGEIEEKASDLCSFIERIKILKSIKNAGIIMKRFGKMSLTDYAKGFKHPAIKAMLKSFLPDGFAASFLFFALGVFTSNNGSIPLGGSREFALKMEKKYIELGGTIKTNKEVKEIIIDEGKVTGIILKNGEIVAGDYVLSSCDADITFRKLLKGKYSDKKFKKRYENPETYPVASCIYLSFGVDFDMKDYQRTQSFGITPFYINEEEISRISITNYSYEPSFSPKGKTLVICSINQLGKDYYDYWRDLYSNKDKYNEEKNRIATKVLLAIENQFPELKGKVKILDVATPITFNRYAGAYKGAFMAFFPTIKGKMMSHTGKIKGIKNFHMVGQWLQPPGGLPVSLITARNTILRICKDEKIQAPFK